MNQHRLQKNPKKYVYGYWRASNREAHAREAGILPLHQQDWT
jgi:hypothetical protein